MGNASHENCPKLHTVDSHTVFSVSKIPTVNSNDISSVLKASSIQKIYANGKTAGKLYQKYIEPDTNMKIEVLPSTSPANAACSLEDLIEAWGILRKDELGK